MKKYRATRKKPSKSNNTNGSGFLPPPYPPPMLIPLTIGNKKLLKSRTLNFDLQARKSLISFLILLYKIAGYTKSRLKVLPNLVLPRIRLFLAGNRIFFRYLSTKQSRIFTFIGVLLTVASIILMPFFSYTYILVILLCAIVQLVVGKFYRTRGY